MHPYSGPQEAPSIQIGDPLGIDWEVNCPVWELSRKQIWVAWDDEDDSRVSLHINSFDMEVPLLDLKAQYQLIKSEIREAIEGVLESQQFILGPEVESLEHEIAAYSQCREGIGISSGTDALLIALMAIELKPGDEVITTPYSFIATAGCVSRLGGKPVFVDIEPGAFTIEPFQIERVVTDKTRAVIPVHLYGQMADMDPIMEIAGKRDLYVIEDAAQALGAEYKGRRAGSIGHFGCFSFFPSKNLGGFGDGGMVTTNDPCLADKIRLLRNHGYRPKYHNKVVGGNFRLDSLQAAVLRVKLRHLDEWTEARRENALRYHRLFQVGSPDKLLLPREISGRRHVFNQFVIRTEHRDSLASHLKEKGIGCEIYYPVPLHLQECFAGLGYGNGSFQESEKAASETLALPIYPELTAKMQRTVVSCIQDFHRATSL